MLLDAPSHSAGSVLIDVAGWERLAVISDQARLRAINAETGTAFLGGAGNEFLSMLFGHQSVFTLDHEPHRLARRVIAASLMRERLATMQPLITQIIVDEFGQLADCQRFDVGLFARRITIRVACLAVLGTSDLAVVNPVFAALEKTTGFLANFVSYAPRLWRPGAKSPMAWIARTRVKAIRELVDGIIAERQAAGPNNGSTLDLLLSRQDEAGYDNEFIRDNIIATLSAGYDTTGSALTWSLFWLSQDKIRNELLASCLELGRRKAVDCFTAESLRICPPLEILPRRPAVAQAGVATMVCPSPLRVHHDPEIFDQPGEFRPARFHEHKFEATQYFPFGAASRLCLGMQLAKQVIGDVLEHVINSGVAVNFDTSRFSPVRRNVSLWPSFRMRATFRVSPGA